MMLCQIFAYNFRLVIPVK